MRKHSLDEILTENSDSRKFTLTHIENPQVKLLYDENNNPYLSLKTQARVERNGKTIESNVEIMKISLFDIDINLDKQLQYYTDENNEVKFRSSREQGEITFRLFPKHIYDEMGSDVFMIVNSIPQKMSLREIERELGYSFELVDKSPKEEWAENLKKQFKEKSENK